jgi:non-heme chloroperoxidase
MSTFTTKDGTEIFYNDWGTGQPIVFSHTWPLGADSFEDQMFFLVNHGYRCIAHDRRGHGRSTQPWSGYDLDTYADDLAALIEKLDLKNIIHVGHSIGGGEVVRYLGRHGTSRASKAVLLAPATPLMLKTATNPGGLPMEAFDGIRQGLAADRSQFLKDVSMPFYNYNLPGAKPSEGVRASFWRQSMITSLIAAYNSVKVFSETDTTEDIKKIDIPVLVIHGDGDQLVPFPNCGAVTAKLLPNSILKVYPGECHGLITTAKDRVNEDILAFIKK